MILGGRHAVDLAEIVQAQPPGDLVEGRVIDVTRPCAAISKRPHEQFPLDIRCNLVGALSGA